MQKENYNVVGVMSGTSLDGIDIAHIQFDFSGGKWIFEMGECETIGYNSEWIDTLRKAVTFNDAELADLNIKYTSFLADVISAFMRKYKIGTIDAVCSHGHTILHQPEKGITLQIGNLPEIAPLLQQTVVCDFRVQDVELGGQGAPLVPIGDRFLFSDYDYCLNLGGFSNVSFEQDDNRMAFDISPVNTVLNFYAGQLGFVYDDKGIMSADGSLNEILLSELNQLDFYKKPFPKSLGFEFVRETILPLMDIFNIAHEDKLRTFTEHIAMQIAAALPVKEGQMLVTGGGAYNDFLIGRIKAHLPDMEVKIPEKKILEFKEALIFALLGVLKLRNEINVLASVTGAEKDHSSGKVYQIADA